MTKSYVVITLFAKSEVGIRYFKSTDGTFAATLLKKYPLVPYSLRFWNNTDDTGTRCRYSALFKRKILLILETIFLMILRVEQWLSFLVVI